MNTENYLDHFLVAMPSLTDPDFEKAVVFLFEHNEENTLGMIINKPLQLTLGSVLEHLHIAPKNPDIANKPVFMGGPVGQENGFIVFCEDKHTSLAKSQISVSASREILCDIASEQGPKDYLITLGYAGWSSGQLESEIVNNDWLVVPANPRILFDTPVDDRWEEAAKLIGIDLNNLSDQTGHA